MKSLLGQIKELYIAFYENFFIPLWRDLDIKSKIGFITAVSGAVGAILYKIMKVILDVNETNIPNLKKKKNKKY